MRDYWSLNDIKKRKGRQIRAAEQTTTAPKPAEMPGWAAGLRRLYDSVVDEDIPDNFRDLISKLDKEG